MNFLKHPTEMADRTENIVKGDEGVRGEGGGLDTGLILVTFSEGIDNQCAFVEGISRGVKSRKKYFGWWRHLGR